MSLEIPDNGRGLLTIVHSALRSIIKQNVPPKMTVPSTVGCTMFLKLFC